MRRRLQRAKRAYFWLGAQSNITVNNTVTTQELYDPAFASIADSKSLRLERVVGWVSFNCTTATASSFSAGLQHVPTSEALVEQNVLNPGLNDTDYFNKKQLIWGGRWWMPVSTAQPLVIQIDIRGRRVVDAAQDMVLMSFVAGSATNTAAVSYWLRALFSKPS